MKENTLKIAVSVLYYMGLSHTVTKLKNTISPCLSWRYWELACNFVAERFLMYKY